MKIRDLEKRLETAREVLDKMAEGNLEVSIEIEHFGDPLGHLEFGINSLISDLRETFASNQEITSMLLEQRREMEEKLATIEAQSRVIRELSTPVLEIWDDVLVLPIIGAVDAERFGLIMETLLARIQQTGCSSVIIDVTGVPEMDAHVAEHLAKITKAAALLGTRALLTGIGPTVAQSLAGARADFGDLTTCANLKEGLALCLARAEPDAEHGAGGEG